MLLKLDLDMMEIRHFEPVRHFGPLLSRNSCTEADPQKLSPTQRRRTQGSADFIPILHMKAEADEKEKERERERKN